MSVCAANCCLTVDELEQWLLAKHESEFRRQWKPMTKDERKRGYRYVTNIISDTLDKLHELMELTLE